MKLSSEVINFQADVIKALGHGLRIQIVDFLKTKERSVTEIIEHFGVDASVVSRQLAILKRAGILGSRKSGLPPSGNRTRRTRPAKEPPDDPAQGHLF